MESKEMKSLIIVLTLFISGCCSTGVVIKQEFPKPPVDLMKSPEQLKTLK